MRSLPATWLLALLFSPAAKPAVTPAMPAVERNVIYGMVSGAALLLDVHRPAHPSRTSATDLHRHC
jgi:hypothetical protein